MNIRVKNVYKLDEGSIYGPPVWLATVKVEGLKSVVEATKAIEDTGSVDHGARNNNIYLTAENEELKGALGRCQANYREMMKQRDRLEAENKELRGQLTDLGNVITEALSNTDYVPF